MNETNLNGTNPNGVNPIEIKPVLVADPALSKSAKKKKIAFSLLAVYFLLVILIAFWGFKFADLTPLALNRILLWTEYTLFGLAFAASAFLAVFWYIKPPLKFKFKKAFMFPLLSGFLAIIALGATFLTLEPRLNPEQFFSSPILSEPSELFGLTAPVDIRFDASAVPIDLKRYQILSYSWNFGDGELANGKVVSHRYTKKSDAGGLYVVTLDVLYRDIKTGEEFSGAFSTQVTIQNERVAANFTAIPSGGNPPLRVNFDASQSFDPDGEIVSYEWDFNGDQRFDDGNGVNVTHEFLQEGSFEVSLRVVDNNGEFNVASKTLEIGGKNGLRAMITSEDISEGSKYLLGVEYGFTGENSQARDYAITKFEWDFGDGVKSSTRKPRHTYEEKGEYQITLKVTDANGNSDETVLTVNVVDDGSAPIAKIKSPQMANGVISGSIPLTVTFDASESLDVDNDIIEYEWDFDGDGEIDARGDEVTHVFEESGSWQVKLILTDSAQNQAEETLAVEALTQGLVADLKFSTSNGEVPLTVSFDASGSRYQDGNIVAYEWDFGDGSKIVGNAKISYKYTKIGTFLASVTVVADDGKREKKTAQILVRPVGLSACFDMNPASGSAPLFVAFDPSCSQGGVSSYEWNFGNGIISFDRRPEVQVYSEPGEYIITLEVTGEQGIVDFIEKTLIVD